MKEYIAQIHEYISDSLESFIDKHRTISRWVFAIPTTIALFYVLSCFFVVGAFLPLIFILEHTDFGIIRTILSLLLFYFIIYIFGIIAGEICEPDEDELHLVFIVFIEVIFIMITACLILCDNIYDYIW